MSQAHNVNPLGVPRHNTLALQQQLIREITCLERQLERLRLRDDLADMTTLQTYEEMINSRRELLQSLPREN